MCIDLNKYINIYILLFCHTTRWPPLNLCTLKHILFVLTYENKFSHHDDGGNTMPIVRTEGAGDQKAMFRRKFAVHVRSMELGIFYPQ